MADEMATITGTIYRNSADDADRVPWAGALVRAVPVLLDETAALADSRTTRAAVTDSAGLVTLHLWPGAWRILLPDGEVIGGDGTGVVVEAGTTYTLLELRGYVAPPGTSVTTVELSSLTATTLAAGEDATVEVEGDGLVLGIPRGADGSQTYASLDDVDLTGLADGDAMVWDATAEKWVRVSLPSTYVAQADAPELIRDTMGSALVAGTNVTITPDDGADTITIAATGGGGGGVTTALYLPGASGNNVTTPTSTALEAMQDLDIRAHIAPVTYEGLQMIVSKYVFSSHGWYLSTDYSGRDLMFRWYTTGDVVNWAKSSVAVPVSDGEWCWVRVTLKVDNGSGSSEVKFYTSLDGETWTQSGSTDTRPTATHTIGTAVVEVGTYNAGATTSAMVGRFDRVSIADMAGTVIASWDGRVPATRYHGPAGESWTVNGTANGWEIV